MTPQEAEGWIKVAIVILGALSGAFGTWVLLRRDVADLKTGHAKVIADVDGIGGKVNGILGKREADDGRFIRIEADIKDLRFFERGMSDRLTRERHDLIDRDINPAVQEIGNRIDGLEDEVKDLKRGYSA